MNLLWLCEFVMSWTSLEIVLKLVYMMIDTLEAQLGVVEGRLVWV
jgi:hypothetical protein